MKLIAEFTVTDNLDAIALEQFLSWAKRLEAVPEVKIPASGIKRVPQAEGTPPDYVEEIVEVAMLVPPVIPNAKGNGVDDDTAAVQAAITAGIAPRRRGPKTKAEKAALAAAAEAAAKAQPAAPPVSTKRPLPGTALPEAPIPAAMPVVEPVEEGAEVSFADLQECYRQSVSLKGPKLAYQIMARETWPDGTDKEGHPKKWYTVEAVPPNHYERLIQEISAAMGG